MIIKFHNIVWFIGKDETTNINKGAHFIRSKEDLGPSVLYSSSIQMLHNWIEDKVLMFMSHLLND